MVGPLALTADLLAAAKWHEQCERIEALKRMGLVRRMGLVCQKFAMVGSAIG
jgi:hypothetical protein